MSHSKSSKTYTNEYHKKESGEWYEMHKNIADQLGLVYVMTVKVIRGHMLGDGWDKQKLTEHAARKLAKKRSELKLQVWREIVEFLTTAQQHDFQVMLSTIKSLPSI